jgi:hypothetical protein
MKNNLYAKVMIIYMILKNFPKKSFGDYAVLFPEPQKVSPAHENS